MAASIPVASLPFDSPPEGIWDSKVVGDLMALPYVRAVVFTNERGRILHVNSRVESSDELGKVIEVALGVIARTGAVLQLGAPKISASVYERGVLIVSRHKDLRLAVLADASSNLGNLLHHVRRAFPEGDQ